MAKRSFAFSICSFAAFLLAGCECNYLSRIYDSQCRPVGGSVSRNRTLAPAPSACSNPLNVKLQVSCPAGSATLCNHFTDGAAIYAVIVADNAGGSFTDVNGNNYPDCSSLWNGLSGLSPSDVTGVYVGAPSSAGLSISCTDAGGCVAASLSGCFTQFDPNAASFTTGAEVVLGSGKFLACAFLDSYALPNPVPPLNAIYNPIPPMGQAAINNLLGNGGPSGLPPAIGSTAASQITDTPVPHSGYAPSGGASQFVPLDTSATHLVNFSSWYDAP